MLSIVSAIQSSYVETPTHRNIWQTFYRQTQTQRGKKTVEERARENCNFENQTNQKFIER